MAHSLFRSVSRHVSALALLIPPALLVAQAPQPQVGLINRDAAVFSERSKELYMVSTASDAILAIQSDGTSKTIRVGSQPDAVAVNNRTGIVYVVNPGSRTVSIIDSAKDEDGIRRVSRTRGRALVDGDGTGTAH